MKKISILIAEDHRLIRQAWSVILNTHPDFTIVGECESGEEAVELSRRLRPDIVLMDINLSGMNGMEATEQVRKFSPGTKVLAVSLHTQPSYTRRMMQKGAMGYLTKNSSRQEMSKAILQIHSGKKYVCKEITEISLDLVTNGNEKRGYNSLSERELEIISFLRKGESSKEIAAVLGIATRTVGVHRYNILKKLRMKNTAALMHYVTTIHAA